MDCKAVPYEGKEPYIFISYCRQDKSFVYPMIENLSKNGYRVWFDNGLQAGDDWPETIASHLFNSAVCIAIISQASCNSHNCKNEIYLASEKKIPLLPVKHTDFELSLGMQMLFGRTQYIKEYDYQMDNASGAESFYRNLLIAESCEKCRDDRYKGMPFRVFVTAAPAAVPAENADLKHEVKQETKEEIAQSAQIKEEIAQSAQIREEKKEEIAQSAQVKEEKKEEISHSDEEVVELEDPTIAAIKFKQKPDADDQSDLDATVAKKTAPRRFAILVDIKEGVYYYLDSTSKLGRDIHNEVYIPDETKTVGRSHALIKLDEKENATITDLDSKNGTFVNNQLIEKGGTEALHNGAIIALSGRELLYLEDECAEFSARKQVCAILECFDTGEKIGLTPNFVLGRNNPWPSGLFTKADSAYKFLSRNHGQFFLEDKGYRFLTGQHVTNGTCYNDVPLQPNQCTEFLQDGDEIKAADKHRIRISIIHIQEYKS